MFPYVRIYNFQIHFVFTFLSSLFSDLE